MFPLKKLGVILGVIRAAAAAVAAAAVGVEDERIFNFSCAANCLRPQPRAKK